MESESIKSIGIKEKRVLLEVENVRETIKLLKIKEGMSQKDINEYIGYFIGNFLNKGCSLPYESFSRLQTLAKRVQKALHVKQIKCRRTYNKQSMEKLAQIIGIKKTGIAGKFLSEEYKGINISHKWQCGKCGYVWSNSPNALLYQNQWCIRCLGLETWTYEQMVDLAKKRGLEKSGVEGKFLTSRKEYESSIHPDMSKYHWKCGKCGHIWKALANNIKRGSWCRNCQYRLLSRKYRTPYNKIVALAKRIGIIKTGFAGVFLANEEEYNSIRHPSNHKFQWKCGKCSNVFEMDISHVKRPQWCPICTEGECEIICRGFFKRLFKAKFPKRRPKWLVSPFSGGQMHFDGYNQKLKLAFEFNGPQHYMFYPKYHREYEDFVKQLELDKAKAELCKKMGIILIVVPHTLDYDEFQDYIVKEYEKLTGEKLQNKYKYDWRTFKQENIDLTEFL